MVFSFPHLRFSKEIAKSVEATFPVGSPCSKPPFGGPQCRCVDPANALPSNFRGRDQTAALQHLQMLHDGRH
jgi:hypothetical protein